MPRDRATPKNASDVAPREASVRPNRPYGWRVGPVEHGIQLTDLLTKRLLVAGAVLEGPGRSRQPVNATVRRDGYIEVAGIAYRSPSAAGGAAKEIMKGRPMTTAEKSTDGWLFWRTRDRSGRLVTLKELRRRAAGM